MKKSNAVRYIALGLGFLVLAASARGTEPPVFYPTAVFPFRERGAGAREQGMKVADLLFGELAAHPSLMLVERQELDTALQEMEMGLSGLVASAHAARVGQLTGARILVTGSVIEADRAFHLVARVIGTETSRVLGATVRGRAGDALAPMVEDLAGQVARLIMERAGELVAPVQRPEDRIAALRERLGDARRPVVMVRIPEQHVSRPVIDPAAETEIAHLLRATGFEVLDPSGNTAPVEISIEGEGFSEFAMRRGNLVMVRARLEVKAVERATGRILAIDRQTEVGVDVAELVAAKTALQNAAATLAERLLPALVHQ